MIPITALCLPFYRLLHDVTLLALQPPPPALLTGDVEAPKKRPKPVLTLQPPVEVNPAGADVITAPAPLVVRSPAPVVKLTQIAAPPVPPASPPAIPKLPKFVTRSLQYMSHYLTDLYLKLRIFATDTFDVSVVVRGAGILLQAQCEQSFVCCLHSLVFHCVVLEALKRLYFSVVRDNESMRVYLALQQEAGANN